MLTNTPRGPQADANPYDIAAGLMSRYPALDPDELAALKYWYRKEASALEVASLASTPWVTPGYETFRADHVDRFGLREWLTLGAVALVLIAGVGVALLL